MTDETGRNSGDTFTIPADAVASAEETAPGCRVAAWAFTVDGVLDVGCGVELTDRGAASDLEACVRRCVERIGLEIAFLRDSG